jgi:hypothetical protein
VRILILEGNLLWSSRLAKTAIHLGHEPIVAERFPIPDVTFDVAIINLASPTIAADVLALKAQNVRLIAHAGHKEKELHALGASLGIDVLATNSELTWKLDTLLDKLSRD